MMRFPYPLYLREHTAVEHTAHSAAEQPSWPVYLAFAALWAVMLALALLVTL